MKYFIKNLFLIAILLFPLAAFALEPYRSLNEVCVVEKKGGSYFFFHNGKEMKARQQEIFGKATRDNFEWFYVSKNDPQALYYTIQAKVYPQMRDAIIDSPSEEMIASVHPCALTQENQRLASTVTYEYTSQDRMCACLKENGKLNCNVTPSALNKAPFEKWVTFFESGGWPPVIIGVVPQIVFKAVWELPSAYHQRISPCNNNTSNENIIRKYMHSSRS